MPLPLLVLIPTIPLAGEGIRRGLRSLMRNSEAKKVNERAQDICDEARDDFEKIRESTYNALISLGYLKLTIFDKSVNRFTHTFSKIANLDFIDNPDWQKELGYFKIDHQSLQEMRELGSMATSLLGGIAAGGAAGALAAFGAFSATMTFGAASTGAAIASLSGVAATNATLAFLGGGTLAAGGFGMAGGMAVLGGVIAGPALAVLGFFMDAKAGKNLDNAYSNLAEAQKIAEECRLAGTMCQGIEERAAMFTKLLKVLDEQYFKPLIERMENIVQSKGFDAANYTDEGDMKALAMAYSVAAAIQSALTTPILTEDGKPSNNAITSGHKLSEYITTLPDKLNETTSSLGGNFNISAIAHLIGDDLARRAASTCSSKDNVIDLLRLELHKVERKKDEAINIFFNPAKGAIYQEEANGIQEAIQIISRS